MYKVLTPDRMSPIAYDVQGIGFKVQALHYPVDEWVSGEFGIFIFDNIADAKRFMGSDNTLEVWKCEARGVRRVGALYLHNLRVLTKRKVLEYMQQGNCFIVADAIKIMERVDVQSVDV